MSTDKRTGTYYQVTWPGHTPPDGTVVFYQDAATKALFTWDRASHSWRYSPDAMRHFADGDAEAIGPDVVQRYAAALGATLPVDPLPVRQRPKTIDDAALAGGHANRFAFRTDPKTGRPKPNL